MIAMQYSFALPADYDMAIVRQRIAQKGHATDGLPGLMFKAYLWAARGSHVGSRENLYAPFYLWHGSAGMNDFLCGPGFASVSQAFGWPRVSFWSVWQAELSPPTWLAHAVCATRELDTIASHADLAALRQREERLAQQDMASNGALAAISAFEPDGWRRLRFRLWDRPRPDPAAPNIQCYEVGYLSQAA